MDIFSTRRSCHYNYNLEILRIVSAFGIVLFHGADGPFVRDVGFTSLIIFALISSYLLIPQENFKLFATKKTSRLLIPWLFWFLAYGLINILSGKFFLPVQNDIFSAILAGTKSHLWYLPFVFITSLSVVFYYNLTEHNVALKKFNLAVLVSLSIIILISSKLWRPWSLYQGAPWAQWFFTLPAVLIGATIFKLTAVSSGHRNIIIFAIAVVLITIWLIDSGLRSVGVPYLLGFALFFSGTYVKFNTMINYKALITLSNCTYGIYLIHPLIYSIERKLGFSDTAVVPFVTYALSMLIILLINSVPIPLMKKII